MLLAAERKSKMPWTFGTPLKPHSNENTAILSKCSMLIKPRRAEINCVWWTRQCLGICLQNRNAWEKGYFKVQRHLQNLAYNMDCHIICTARRLTVDLHDKSLIDSKYPIISMNNLLQGALWRFLMVGMVMVTVDHAHWYVSTLKHKKFKCSDPHP